MSQPTSQLRIPVDWARLKQRVAEVDEALAAAHAPSPEQRRAALETRARSLAMAVSPGVDEAGRDVISFLIGQQAFAVEAACVREVSALNDFTPLPCAAAFVSGIINVHGRIVAVIDLRKFLQLPESGLSDLNKVVILEEGDMEFGVLADRILGAERLRAADIVVDNGQEAVAPAPRRAFVRGLVHGRLLVLDAKALFSDARLLIDEESIA